MGDDVTIKRKDAVKAVAALFDYRFERNHWTGTMVDVNRERNDALHEAIEAIKAVRPETAEDIRVPSKGLELRIILKDPADGNPLDLPIQGGDGAGDHATISWRLTHKGKEYGQYIKLDPGMPADVLERGVLLVAQWAFNSLQAIMEADHETD